MPRQKSPMAGLSLDIKEKPLVLIGLMGAGKSSVGRVLAKKLGRRFIDSDTEVEKAAGMSIEDIFEVYGEADFRDVEERVITRLLSEGPVVLATGGGAYMNERTRARISSHAFCIWLRADLEELVKRTSRRGGRPLLKDQNPRDKLKSLMEMRYPVYQSADLVIDSVDETPEKTAAKIVGALDAPLETNRTAET